MYLNVVKTFSFLEFVVFSAACALGMNSKVLLTCRIGIAGLLDMTVMSSLGRFAPGTCCPHGGHYLHSPIRGRWRFFPLGTDVNPEILQPHRSEMDQAMRHTAQVE